MAGLTSSAGWDGYRPVVIVGWLRGFFFSFRKGKLRLRKLVVLFSFWDYSVFGNHCLYLRLLGKRLNCTSLTDIFDESVFAFILGQKSASFNKHKEEQFTHHLVWCTMPFWHCLHTGVGYCLFVFGLCRASVQIDEVLHTFFIVVIPIGAPGKIHSCYATKSY